MSRYKNRAQRPRCKSSKKWQLADIKSIVIHVHLVPVKCIFTLSDAPANEIY